MWASCAIALVFLRISCAAGPQAPAKRPNPLVAGKLVAVEPMPGNLDKWILDDLRVWGKYKLTGDPEGASLVMEAHAPEKRPEYEVRGGIPQPRKRVPGIPAAGT